MRSSLIRVGAVVFVLFAIGIFGYLSTPAHTEDVAIEHTRSPQRILPSHRKRRVHPKKARQQRREKPRPTPATPQAAPESSDGLQIHPLRHPIPTDARSHARRKRERLQRAVQAFGDDEGLSTSQTEVVFEEIATLRAEVIEVRKDQTLSRDAMRTEIRTLRDQSRSALIELLGEDGTARLRTHLSKLRKSR